MYREERSNMNDITILHLSDLHINSMYASCSYSLNKMLEDIQNQTRCLKNIVIVVTGDIVHKGKRLPGLAAHVLAAADGAAG